jgi:molybdenum cofactor cytidylyltransferase
MTTPLSERLGLHPRELIAIVGAGGKTTIMGILAGELSSDGARLILTTTTKMGADQVTEPVCWSDDSDIVEGMLLPGVPLSVLIAEAGGKVTGLQPDAVDTLFDATSADYIIVEADGARSLSIKAPADHEPVIPSLSTTVIVVVGADALGSRLRDVAHRMDRISTLTGLLGKDVLTPEAAASILLHPNGGLKSIPESSTMSMVIAKVSDENRVAADTLAAILERHPRVDQCVLVQFPYE